MSSRKERLEAAKKDSLLVGLAVGARSPSQVPKAIEDLRALEIEFTSEAEKIAKVVAQLKKSDQGKFKAIFGKILERKESKVEKLDKKEAIKKVQSLMKEVQRLKGEFGIKDEELVSVVSKVEERKKEAVEKRISEKALTIVQKLGRTCIGDVMMGSQYCDDTAIFRNKDFKILAKVENSTDWVIGKRWVEIYTVKGKLLKHKQLVYQYYYDEKVKIYKPGEWEKSLDSLYKTALILDEEEKKERFGL